MAKVLLPVLIALLLLPVSAMAQDGPTAPALPANVVAEPICFMLVNQAPYRVYGTFGTDYYTNPETGQKARHRSNFRLEEAGTKDPEKGYPLDQAEFCSYGPFYPDQKLDLVIRTLVPIFSCKTKIDQGPIIITGVRKPEGGTDTKAACFE